MNLVDTATMKAADERASGRDGASVLMQRAGQRIAQLVQHIAPQAQRVVGFAGPGNNGGDVFAACAALAQQTQVRCTIYADQSGVVSGARQDAERAAQACNITVHPLPDHFTHLERMINEYDLVLDGLLGIGARNDTTRFAPIIDAINAAQIITIALDVPTGINSTTGALATPTYIRADHTIMIGLPKLGVVLQPARTAAGRLWVADIGITADSEFQILNAAEAAQLLPQRAENTEKRSAGAPLLIAGSIAYPGAAVLCARAAARMGAGYVTVATPQDNAATLRAHLVEQVVVGFDPQNIDASVALLLSQAQHANAIAIGPGLPLHDAILTIVLRVVAQTKLPLVLDATALRLIRDHLDDFSQHRCIITPHAGEFAHLLGINHLDEAARIPTLRDFVKKTQITTLLKGSATLIADGTHIHVNSTGTNALATAGSGDVLTGMIATLLAQGLSPVDAGRLGAYLHGLAGQQALRVQHRGVIAGDVIAALQHVWPTLAAHNPHGLVCLNQP